MKKIICALIFIAIVLSLSAAAFAESIDLSTLSWEELLELKTQLTMEQWSREEWQEVEVPNGLYTVGKDIPAGKWVVSSAGDGTQLIIGSKLNETGNDISYMDFDRKDIILYSESSYMYEKGSCTEYVVTLSDGMYVVIGNLLSAAIFRPYTGSSLGFK